MIEVCSDYLKTFFNRFVCWPSCTRTHVRIGSVLEEHLCIRFLPMAE